MHYQIIVIMSFFVLLFLSFPIALTILFTAIVGLYFRDVPLTILIPNLYGRLTSLTYLAVPMYIFAGTLMNELGIAERIFSFANSIVGHVKGGLAHVNVFASMIFAGMSGSSTADCAGLGRVEIKAMNEAGYDPAFSAAITAASSIIGPIIPPSIHMMIFAMVAEVPAAAILIAGIGPGLIIGFSLMITIYILSIMGKIKCSVNPERLRLRMIFQKFKEGFWALLAPVIIVGGILGGVVTATEAGVIAVAYTLLVGGFIYKTLTIDKVSKCLDLTIYSIGVISFIMAVAAIFTWYVTIENVPELFVNFVLSVTSSHFLILLMVAVMLLILGTVATASANIVLVTPILLPLLLSVGLDPIHIGVFIVFGLVIGIVTPPVGAALYIVSDVAKVPFEKVVMAILPFYIPLIIGLLLIMFIPAISLFLPRLFRLM